MEPWIQDLRSERFDAAWDRFVDRYRRLLFAAIRRYADDYDDVMDAFAYVCEQLRADGMRRLRSYVDQPEHRAKFSTWLVTVVHHLTIDWIRRREGRPLPPALSMNLPPLRRRIFDLVVLEQRSHVEAYEVIQTGERPDLTFREFLAELRATYVTVGSSRMGRALLGSVIEPAPTEYLPDTSAAERREVLANVMGSLSAEDRTAVQLYVVNEMPAADVARVVGWSGAKVVYNRVYRALMALRERLERAGVRREDL